MLYYLLYDPREDRLMVADAEHLIARLRFEIRDKTEASSWLEAKKALGFPLTATQEMLLASEKASSG